MSYDIYFWKQQPNTEVNAGQLLNELQDGVQLPSVIGIPLETIKQAFQKEFPEIKGGPGSLDWEGDGSYFQVGFVFLDERTASMITVFCGYELLNSQQAIKRIEKVASSLGCRVYDPQQT
jgi:hypothetical protein